MRQRIQLNPDNYDKDSICKSLGISEEREKEMFEYAQTVHGEANYPNTSTLLTALWNDSHFSPEELIFMLYHIGAITTMDSAQTIAVNVEDLLKYIQNNKSVINKTETIH